MKVRIKRAVRQVCFAAFISLALISCNMKKGEKPVSPPLTFPLSQTYIGYGVINVSYTRVNVSTEENSASVGYLRQGSVVRIIERRLVKNEIKTETWVLIGGSVKGWLKEAVIDIYNNERQAVTASNSMRE